VRKPTDARQRILDAAITLFAHKGYAAVGIREIAGVAGVNLAMVSYYYKGKAGLLAAIVGAAGSKFSAAIAPSGKDDLSREERVRLMARGLVAFFRENTELGMVAFNAFRPADDAETMKLRVLWANEVGGKLDEFCRRIGFDGSDPAQAGAVRGALLMNVMTFFEGLHALRVSSARPRAAAGVKLDDAFFDRYADSVADLFLRGIVGLRRKQPRVAR
jgi:AcrR family transcriptional regulator